MSKIKLKKAFIMAWNLKNGDAEYSKNSYYFSAGY